MFNLSPLIIIRPFIVAPLLVHHICCLVLCRQVGAELHQLTPALPLFDGVTGQAVAQATDSRVERLRDVLMDDARERVDNLGEALVAGRTGFVHMHRTLYHTSQLGKSPGTRFRYCSLLIA